MKRMHVCWLAALLALGDPARAAEGDTYVAAQYALVEIDFDGGADVDPKAVIGRFGVFLTDQVAFEGRFGIGLDDDEIFDVEVEVDTLFGAYLALYSRLSARNSFYGVFGFTEAELDYSGPGGSVSDDESGLSFGFGANIGQMNVEFMYYLDDDDFDATAIGLGFIF